MTAPSERGDDLVETLPGEGLSAPVLPPALADATRLRVGPLEIDIPAREVLSDDLPLALTAKEFDLLAYLAARPGHVFSREQLLHAVWQSASDWQQPSTVTEHIRRLRLKVEADPGHPVLLTTVRGAGYRLDLPARADPDEGGDGDRPDHGELAVPGTIVHVDGVVVFADASVGTFLGCADADELVGRRVLDLVAPGSLDAARERVELTAACRSQLLHLRRVDGVDRLVEVSSTAVDWHGEPAGSLHLLSAVDLSSRLRSLATGVLTELTDAVIITDLRYHVQSWNRAAERMYGWTSGEAVGRHVLDLFHWNVSEDELAEAWETLQVSGRWTGETTQVTRDGSTISARASTTMVRDEVGEPVGIVSVNRPSPTRPARVHREPGRCDPDEIRAGLAADEFEIFYQPVVALHDRSTVAVEALVRWHHPTRGLLQPPAFLDSAERSGLLIELGSLVLDRACHQVAAWRAADHGIDVGVNISTRQLADPSLIDRVTHALASSDLPPGALWLEVTETALVEQVDTASEVLRRLVDLGVRIAIDNFGTGWSSLAYLQRFPVHALKIDRSFVAGAGRDAFDTAYARSVIALSAELDLFTVAEGIETESQHEALRRIGCSVGQGFLYGRPVPAAEVRFSPQVPVPSALGAVPAEPGPATDLRILDHDLPLTTSGVVAVIGLDRHGDAAIDADFERMLADHAGPTRSVCRAGGGTFAVIGPGLEVSDVVAWVDGLRTTWARSSTGPATISAGLAAMSPLGGTSTLLAADRALHRARAVGPDRTEVDLPPATAAAH